MRIKYCQTPVLAKFLDIVLIYYMAFFISWKGNFTSEIQKEKIHYFINITHANSTPYILKIVLLLVIFVFKLNILDIKVIEGLRCQAVI